jgi:hypothetical protein
MGHQDQVDGLCLQQGNERGEMVVGADADTDPADCGLDDMNAQAPLEAEGLGIVLPCGAGDVAVRAAKYEHIEEISTVRFDQAGAQPDPQSPGCLFQPGGRRSAGGSARSQMALSGM